MTTFFLHPLVLALVYIWLPIVLAGCSGVGTISTKGTYKGLGEGLEEDGALRIVLIHGMRHTTPNYSNPLRKKLAEKLQLSPYEAVETVKLRPDAVLTIFSLENRRVIFYELTWSDITRTEKYKNFKHDSLFHEDRSYLSRTLKRDIINDGLGDAVAYLNPELGGKIRAAIRDTLVRVSLDFNKTKDELVFVSMSLGSKILFDTLCLNEQRRPKVAFQAQNALVGDELTMIMFANQIPLMNLSAVKTCELERSTLLPNPKSLATKRLHVIDVSDLDDILSYPLEPGEYDLDDEGTIIITSVKVVNMPLAFTFLPGYFVAAHTGHKKNERLLNALVRGF